VKREGKGERCVLDLLDTQVFPLVGVEGFGRLVAGFYRRVSSDDILGPMYRRSEGASDDSVVDLSAAEERLRDFLIQRFGGPQDYSRRRGHPRLRMRHFTFAIDPAARDRWVQLMEQSLAETRLPPEAERVLRRFFHESATFLINRPVL
jgi:hemoglobin